MHDALEVLRGIRKPSFSGCFGRHYRARRLARILVRSPYGWSLATIKCATMDHYLSVPHNARSAARLL